MVSAQPAHARAAKQLRRKISDSAFVARAVIEHWESEAGHFDRLTQRSDAARIEASDLIAIRALGAPASVGSCAWVLGDLGQWLTTEILADVPIGVDLGDADARTIHRVADVFNLLRSEAGMTRSATTRLLAAKRPALVPIDDRTMRESLRYTKSDTWWQLWRGLLEGSRPSGDATEADAEIDFRALVATARDEAAETHPEVATMTTLRMLDAALRNRQTV